MEGEERKGKVTVEGKVKRASGRENDKGDSVVGRGDERSPGRKEREKKKIRESRIGERREAGKMKIDSMAR